MNRVADRGDGIPPGNAYQQYVGVTGGTQGPVEQPRPGRGPTRGAFDTITSNPCIGMGILPLFLACFLDKFCDHPRGWSDIGTSLRDKKIILYGRMFTHADIAHTLTATVATLAGVGLIVFGISSGSSGTTYGGGLLTFATGTWALSSVVATYRNAPKVVTVHPGQNHPLGSIIIA